MRSLASFVAILATLRADVGGTALVSHAPTVNGTIEGSVQQMLGEAATLNGGGLISGDWAVPGTPTVRLNGKPTYGGTTNGVGSATPTGYQITLNGGATLGHVLQKTDPVALPIVSAPPLPVGTRAVTINSASDIPGSFTTVRNLNLNGNVGQFLVPPGSYGDFTANGGSGFTLGVAGSVQPTVYNFQHLVLNGSSRLQVVGPVVVTVANGITANGMMGSTANPAWLAINIYAGGLTLNGGASLYGTVNAPSGTVVVNGSSQLVGGVACDRLTVNGGGLLQLVVLSAGNHAPVANALTFSTSEDKTVATPLTASDADGDTLTYTVVGAPAHGSLGGSGASLTYTPAADFAGIDTFTFKASDGQADSNVATATITVTAVNDAPVASIKATAVDEDGTVAITLSGTDADGDALTFTWQTPAHGALSGTSPNLTYTPVRDFAGLDSFTFTASDGKTTSAPATVAITVRAVNDAPVAENKSYSVDEGSTVAVTLSGSDVDDASSTLVFSRTSSPAHGMLSGTAPNFVYTPAINFSGVDTFTFTVSDGKLTSAQATITIAVTDQNFAPVAIAGSGETDEDRPATFVLSATDRDLDPLSYVIVIAPRHGTLAPVAGRAGAFVYTPETNYNGSDSFTFKANDGLADSNAATFAIVIHAVNDAPTAADQAVQVDEDGHVTITLSGVDVEGSALMFALTQAPNHGTLGAILAGANNTATVVYTPAANYNGPDSFGFRTNDGATDSPPALVAIAVKPVNDAPVAQSQTLELAEDAVPVAITLGGNDVDSATLSYAIAVPPLHGTLTASPDAPNIFLYAPAANYNGRDSFAFAVSDGELSSAAAQVDLTIKPVNDAPVADGGSLLVGPQDTPINVTLVASDVDQDPLTYSIVTLPQHGTVSGTAPNLTYTPAANYRGDDSLVFRVSDGQAASRDAIVRFRLTPVSHAPTAQGTVETLAEDTPRTLVLSATDVDGEGLSCLIVTPPQHGSLVATQPPIGTFAAYVYTPAKDFSGTDSFTFKAYDGALYSEPAKVTLTITPVNDAPVASAVSVTLAEDTVTQIAFTAIDAEGDPLTYRIVTPPSHGTLVLGAGGMSTYTPEANYHGADSFTFKASDGVQDSNLATASLSITPVNDAPVANVLSLAATTGVGIPATLTATDADGDALNYTVVTPPAHGVLSGTAPNLTYTSVTGYVGADMFTYKANDGTTDSGGVTVSLQVAAPVDGNPIVNAGQDQQIVVQANARTCNSIIVNNDEWTFSNTGFDLAPSAKNFALNIAKQFADGKPGHFLVYSQDFGMTESQLLALMASAGHTWEVTTTRPLTLAVLQSYDGIFLDATSVDNDLLIEYVEHGGNVYVCGGRATSDQVMWKPFLAHFGLGLADVNPIVAVVPVTVSHPLLNGVEGLYYFNGNNVTTRADDPRITVLNRSGDYTLVAVWSGGVAKVALTGALSSSTTASGATVATTWSKVSGPGEVRFANANALSTDAILGSAGTYVFRLVATDGTWVKSSDVTVTVLENASPAVDAGPALTALSAPANLRLAGAASDDGLAQPLVVTWTELAGPGTVTFGDTHAADTTAGFPAAGVYLLQLSAFDGMEIVSRTVTVRVGVRYASAAPSGLTAWWSADSVLYNAVNHGNYVQPLSGAGYTVGNPGLAFKFDGVDDAMYVAAASEINVGGNPAATGLSVEFWLKPTATVGDYTCFAWFNGTTEGVGAKTTYNGRLLQFNLRDTNGVNHVVDYTGQLAMVDDVWQHLAFTYDALAGLARIYRNGIVLAERDVGKFTPKTTGDLWLGSAPSNHVFHGALDEFSLYTRALTPAEVEALAGSANGKPPSDVGSVPVVSAGPATYAYEAGQGTSLVGTVQSGTAVTTSWSAPQTPGLVTFAQPGAASTSATTAATGLFLLDLTADNGVFMAQDWTELRVGLHSPVLTTGPSAWWPMNRTPKEAVAGGNGLQLLNGARYVAGQVGAAVNLGDSNALACMPANPNLNVGSSQAGFSIEFWVRPTFSADFPLFTWMTNGVVGVRATANYNGTVPTFLLVDAAGVTRASVSAPSTALVSGIWQHLAFTYDRVTGFARIFRNGFLLVEQNVGVFAPQTAYDLWVGSRPDDRSFRGDMDEVAVFARALSSGEVASIFAAGTAGKAPTAAGAPPVVNAGADLVLAEVSTTATLAGRASDDGLPLALKTSWSVRNGPGSVTFGNAHALTTTATFSAAGTYLLELAAYDGIYESADLVEVRVGVATALAPPNLAAWWPVNSDPRDVLSGDHSIAFFNGLGYGDGHIGEALAFDGVDDYGVVAAHSDLNVGTSTAGFSLEFWLRPDRLLQGDFTILAFTNGTELRAHDNGAELWFRLYDTNGGTHFVTAGVFSAAEQETWMHLAFTYDKATGMARCFRNGLLKAEQNVGITWTPKTNTDLILGGKGEFKGAIDELALYRRPLRPAEIVAIFEAGVDGKCPLLGHSAPVVSAGPDVSLTSTAAAATLSGSVVADGQPLGAPSVQWSVIDGPGSVTFATPAAVSTTATFSATGTYLLQLTASDHLLAPVSDYVEVRVGVTPTELPTGVAAWWPANNAPTEVINGGHDVEFYNRMGFGPGKVLRGFAFDGVDDYGFVPAHADLDVGTSAAGFSIEFWVRPDRLLQSDFTILGFANATELRAHSNGAELWFKLYDTNGGTHFVSAGVFSAAERGTWIHLGFTYDRTTGEARCYKNGALSASQTFMPNWTPRTNTDLILGGKGEFKGVIDELALYRRPLTAAELLAIFNAGNVGKLPLRNGRPQVSIGGVASVQVGSALSLTATAIDDGLPNPPAALTCQWAKISGPGTVAFSAATAWTTSATFDAAGTYVLRCTASDSLLGGTADVQVTVIASDPKAPTVAIYEPAAGAKLPIATYFEIAAHATSNSGTIAKVEFYQGSTKLGQKTLPAADDATTYFWPMTGGLAAGSYSFTAVATDSAGLKTTSAAVVVTVVTDPGAPTATILSPDDGGRISAPTAFTGLVQSSLLANWQLQYRLKVAEGAAEEAWTTFGSGKAEVGTPASGTTAAIPGALGTFDPTALVNGIYEVRLGVTDTIGRTLVDGPITVIVEGNMKVGIFTLAFEDLKVPVAGLPITVTRTYDSRDTRVGDFGPGWRLALANVRVQKNRNLGQGWYQTPQSGNGIQFYNVDPLSDRLVTVVMPDGETHRFKAGAYVKNRDGDPDDASFAVVVREGDLRFYPVGDTTSKLEPLDSQNQLAAHFYIGGTGEQDLSADEFGFDVYTCSRYRLTTKDGTVFLLDEALGLLEMHDLNGNTLVVNRDAANRAASVVSTLQASPAPIVTKITIHRDATGRVESLEDPAGQELNYLYDAQGRLTSVTDRELATTQFKYLNASFPYYLTDIVDPRGITALRSEYDDAGKLIKQTDANGKETLFNRGIDATGRFEKVKNRLGQETTFYYDERGNVTLKLDPLGAQTTYTYYADTDRVKFEVDHYGNVVSRAFDAQGNLIVETTGASLADDPASPTTGYTTRTAYNVFGAPTEIVDPDGRKQSFTYDATTNSLLTHTVGVGGSAPATTTFTYDADGTLHTQTDALGNVTTYTSNHAFSDAAFPGAVKEVTITVAGPSAGGVAGATLKSTRQLYDAQENELAAIATRHLPDGSSEEVVTRFVYDSENRLLATIAPDGRVTETRYNAFGKPDQTLQWQSTAAYQSKNDAKARITGYGYDAAGNQVSVIYADGSSEAGAFDAENRRIWSQDPLGHRTFFVYDDAGRQTATILPDADDGVGAAAPTSASAAVLANNPRTTTTYDLIGRVTDTYDEMARHSRIVYGVDGTADALRRKESVQVLASGNLTTSYQYDSAGNVRYVTDPRGNTVETQYDDQGRPVHVVFPATDEHPSTQTTTTYDLVGRRVAVADQEGRMTRYRYDSLGRLVEVRQYLDETLAAGDADFHLSGSDAKVVSTGYTYDELGRQLTQTDSLGRTTTYWTDGIGRRTKRILPKDAQDAGALTESLEYDGWGNLWHRTDFAGKITTYEYDALNRLTAKSADASHPSLTYSHAAARIEYDYDANGQRTAARTYNAAKTLLYSETTPRDERGRVDYKDTPNGRLDYDYYANGQLQDTVSSNPNGVNLGYRYDGLNRLEYVDDASTGTTQTSQYTYNANGSLETLTQANGVVHTWSYDTLNRLRTLQVGVTSQTAVHTYEYKLNLGGHRHQVLEGAKTTTYTYDALYRLKDETVTGGSQNGVVGYELDKVGNRSTRTSSLTGIANQSFTYNARDWLNGDTYNANGSTVSGRVGTGFGLLTTGSFTDTYDFEERLILRMKSDGTSINLSYDADGNRIAKNLLDLGGGSTSSTTWLVDTNNLTGYAQVVEESVATSAGTTHRTYTYGTTLLAQATLAPSATEPTLAYYAFDGHGNVRELTDATGKVTDTYAYDAFGNVVYRSGSTTNAFLYCGEQFDGDLGLYYLRARYMNADSGRFWSMDDYEGMRRDPQSLHKYIYAHSNPVTGIDPSGHETLIGLMGTESVIGTLGKLAVVAAVYVVSKAVVADFDQVTEEVKDIARRLRRSPSSALIGESMERVWWAKARRYRTAETLPDLEALGIPRAEWMVVNHVWIRKVMAKGSLIIDIGYDPDRFAAGLERGMFYTMELGWTQGYWNKVSDPTIPGSLHLP